MTETEKVPVKVTYLIVGAGPCGLYLGKLLQARRKDFLIVEKSRGVGGRVATRRIENILVDHGAPYLKSSKQLMDLMVEYKVPGLKIDQLGLFTDEGMTILFKKMASLLPVKKEVKIINIMRRNDQWLAVADSGESFLTDHLILTAPLPQSLELLNSSNIDYKYKYDLNTVAYSKALIGLFLTDKEIVLKQTLPEKVHSLFTMKYRSSERASVLRLNESYSEANFQKTDDQILEELEKFFISSCESTGRIIYRELKKWRYALPLTSLNAPYVEATTQLYLAGDAFQYPDIRGALFSAEALAQKLI